MAKTLDKGRKPGSGRPPGIKSIIGFNQPATPPGESKESLVIPNLSGDLSKGRIRATPTEDLNPVNKKFLDDNYYDGSEFTAGSVIFSDGTNLAQDNANLFWDDTNKRLGIGTTAPTYELDVAGNIGVDEYIYHNGDADTNIRFQADRVTFLLGNVELLDLIENDAQDIVVIGGATDIDVKLKGGGGSVFIQGSDGYVGINDITPSYPLDISGNTMVGGELYITGNVGIGTTSPNETLELGSATAALSIQERAAAPDHTAAHGKLWVKTGTPCELWFTADDGTDTKIV